MSDILFHILGICTPHDTPRCCRWSLIDPMTGLMCVLSLTIFSSAQFIVVIYHSYSYDAREISNLFPSIIARVTDWVNSTVGTVYCKLCLSLEWQTKQTLQLARYTVNSGLTLTDRINSTADTVYCNLLLGLDRLSKFYRWYGIL